MRFFEGCHLDDCKVFDAVMHCNRKFGILIFEFQLYHQCPTLLTRRQILWWNGEWVDGNVERMKCHRRIVSFSFRIWLSADTWCRSPPLKLDLWDCQSSIPLPCLKYTVRAVRRPLKLNSAISSRLIYPRVNQFSQQEHVSWCDVSIFHAHSNVFDIFFKPENAGGIYEQRLGSSIHFETSGLGDRKLFALSVHRDWKTRHDFNDLRRWHDTFAGAIDCHPHSWSAITREGDMRDNATASGFHSGLI